jgi:CRISPR-associated protein Cas5h
MQMMTQIEQILAFSLSGRFAHFRKFYTNASSLSYLVPPRTVVLGILGSILMMPRDSYYDRLNPQHCRVSVAVNRGFIKKTVQSVNMIHDSYHRFLCKGTGQWKGMHSQCKLELLWPGNQEMIGYRVYTAFPREPELHSQLEQKLQAGHQGYGIYLGQRPFRAQIDGVHTYPAREIVYLEQSDILDSICLQENVISIAHREEADFQVVVEQMPIHMAAVGGRPNEKGTGREPVSVKRVLFERNGRRLRGLFQNCYRVGDRVISFY